MYCPSSVECDRCGKKLGDERYEDSDEDKVYCEECFDRLKAEVERLEAENANLKLKIEGSQLAIERSEGDGSGF